MAHRAGVRYLAADALPRNLTAEVENTELNKPIPGTVVNRMEDREKIKAVVVLSWRHNENLLSENSNEHEVGSPTLSECNIAQSKRDLCEQSRHLVGTPGIAVIFDKNRIIVRKDSIDGSIQKVVPTSFRASLLSQARHLSLAGNPGIRRM